MIRLLLLIAALGATACAQPTPPRCDPAICMTEKDRAMWRDIPGVLLVRPEHREKEGNR